MSRRNCYLILTGLMVALVILLNVLRLERTKSEWGHQTTWSTQQNERSETFQKTRLNKLATSSLSGHSMKVIDAESARRKLISLKKQTRGLWQGLDPVAVHEKFPGIILNGDYMLREFVDPRDSRAGGMHNKPKSIDEMSTAAAEDRFYHLVTVNHLHCANTRRMGEYGDGGWDLCGAEPYVPQKGCIVYSFGIDYDFTFDDAMGDVYGCLVNSYDPSMKPESYKRSDHVFFHKVGLGPSNTTEGGWTLMSWESILESNNHTNKSIDYLKIDIEYNEWEVLEVMLRRHSLRKVKQFALEIHTSELYHQSSSKLNFLGFYNLLLGLEKQGFRRYHHHSNPVGRYVSPYTGRERTCCYELYYININYLKDHFRS